MSKGKDPAVLFYTADFLADTTLWTYEELGRYIKLLCIQHLQGGVSEDDFVEVVGTCKRVSDKFAKGEDGLYRNKRMAEEIEHRASYLADQSAKGKKGAISRWHSHSTAIAQPMAEPSVCQWQCENENINENININVIKDIVEYLNGVLGANYKFSSGYIHKTITDRLGEGYTFEDFKTVIDKKYAEWHGTEFAKYLRPETLFGPKFERYLNEPTAPIKSGPKMPPQASFTHDEGMARALMRSYGEEAGTDG